MEKFIVLAPFAASIIAGFGWRVISEKGAQVLTTAILFAACVMSWILFLGFDGTTRHIPVMDWVVTGDFRAEWAIRLDRLTAIMLIVVTSVSALVHLYSMGYMAHDDNWAEDEPYRARFFAYLSFFTFAMLMLVTADNLLQMFFGWEGVGVASYLLIGFYYRKPSANAAAMKAFIVNRVGDFGFLLGIFGIFWLTGTIRFDEIFAQVPQIAQTELPFLWTTWNAANLLGVLLFIGAMGKSAQLGLHTWLPDAMEGPTPVSALIHAATMVTAGVFLVCRMSPLYEFAPDAKNFIVLVGACTAFFAATVGLVQNDIKRVIAYSTCSQLGYMFVAAGVGVYSVAMFHLLTHAFFKAMLFLGAGSVIHAMHHEQDLRNYGGLRKKIPLTFWAMLIGTLAITGVGIPLTTIGFAGFLSKDAVIESAYGSGHAYAFWLLVIAAMFTSFYSWRLMFLTFWGAPRPQQVWDAEVKAEEEVQPQEHGHAAHGHDDHHHGGLHAHEHAHESPAVMLVPLAALAVGAVFSGMVWYNQFFGDHERMAQFFHMGHDVHAAAEGAPAADHAAAPEGTAAAGPVHADAVQPAGEGAEAGHDSGAAGHDLPAPVGGAIYMHPDNHVLDAAHHAPVWVKVAPFFAMLAGLAVAWVMYIRNPGSAAALAAIQRPLYRFLLNKWYFDEVYDAVFVRTARWLGRALWTGGDGRTIDGAINGVAMGLVPRMTRFAGRVQSGYLFHYAFGMVLGLVGLLIWVMARGMN
ncbi:NADH-quinone oxidoreductase subunit L [Paracoccus contaminans]|uniref:NADH-quinone oxidoreductase subunit L n=1 Tax=Paracoccus contaminans TaxID=1945662 RepID=A0A1W6CUE2_9RHOB|nr:NADH-quinone oxidoreductase subunit L [Paracoccus contaminans]ARJ68488.1 NADH-quinone oxidoreductase subunit L [Paracoccus contaminans]